MSKDGMQIGGVPGSGEIKVDEGVTKFEGDAGRSST